MLRVGLNIMGEVTRLTSDLRCGLQSSRSFLRVANMPMKIGIYCMVRVVCLDQREYMFENFEENHVLLRPGAKVTQFYADGVGRPA